MIDASLTFDRPPVGYSLTREPKNAPFEHPPELTDPIEAVTYHLDKMNNPEAFEDITFFLENGVDIATLVQGICRGGVMDGMHSLDVSLIIAPVLHEFIKDVAEVAQADFDEGLDDPDARRVIKYQRDEVRANKILKQVGISITDKIQSDINDQDMMEPESIDKEVEVVDTATEPEAEFNMEDIAEKPMGLMSRGEA